MKFSSDDINTISYMQILNESIEVYEILNGLKETDKKISSLLSVPMIPFIAFIVDGIIQMFPEEFDFVDYDIHFEGESFKKTVRRIRVGHKLLSDKRYSSKKKIIDNKQIGNYNNLTRGYNGLQNLVIKLFGQEDYGVFRYENIDFANNIQGYLYFDTVNSSNSEGQGEKISEIARCLSSFLSNFVRGSQSCLKFKINSNFIIDANIKDFALKDYFLFDSKRKNIFNEKLNSNIQALLHSHLCQLNFLDDVFPSVFNGQKNCLLRFKLIAFLEAIKILKDIFEKETEIDIYEDILRKITNSDVYGLLSLSSVRNNIAHYRLKDYDPNIFTRENSIESIIEFESQKMINSFYKDFEKEFEMTKILLKKILFS